MTGERKPMSVDQIEEAALDLPHEEFDELLGRLNSRRAAQSEIEAAWIEEAERRMEMVRAGTMPLIDADDVLADPDEDL